MKNFVRGYSREESFAEEMVEYNEGTVIRTVAVNGKPNEYKSLKLLALGAGTAVYKSLLFLLLFCKRILK